MKRLYTILAIFLLFLPDIFADGITDEEEIKKNMPKYAANINNVGRDYWFTVPPAYLIGGIDNFIKIFVFSAEESEVTVSVPGLGYKELKAIPKNNVAVYNISPATAQVKIYSYNEGPLDAELHRGRGINVTSPSPITVYCVVRYSATSDGFLCIPTNALGNSYVASPYSSRPIGGPDQSLPNMVGVTATQDNTKMKFTLGGNSGTEVPMGGGKYLLPGQSKTYKMDRGDVVVFSNRSGAETLTGSLIEADKNIAVVSAHYCADIPVDNHWCDYNGEMDLPIHSWGQHYHVPMVQRRKYPSVLRIMAAKDKTTVFRDGYEIGFINDGKGGFEQSGWMERRVLSYVPDLNGIALYSGDKPIYVMFYNVGTQEDGNGYDPTDPFSMVLSPVEQYQNEIKFCTPAVNGEGKNFSNNYVMLVYALDEFGTQPDDLEIGDYRNGEFVYKPVPNEGTDMQYVTLDEVNSVSGAELKVPAGLGDKKYAMKVFDVSEGVHSLRSSLPFACYAYGGDPYDSYGYPASLGLNDLSSNDSIPFITALDVDFSIPFDIADTTAEPIKRKLFITASCNNAYGADLVVTNVDDSQLPPEFTHNIPDNFLIETKPNESGALEFELEFYPNKVGKYEGKILFEAENGGCDSVCIVTAEAISSKGLDDKQSQFIQVHPNPVKDELNISFIDNSNKNYDIQLVDMTGNILYSITTKSNQTINMNKYSTGLYYIIIKDKSGKMIRKEKIIKQ